jgi:hypothetical protein
MPSRKCGKGDGGGTCDDGSGGVQEQGRCCEWASIVVGRREGPGGNGGGNVGRYDQLAMRDAVVKSYKASWAAARIAAVNAGEYALRRVWGRSVVNGGGVVLGTADNHDPRGRSGTGDEGGCGIIRVDNDDNVPHKTMVLHGRWWAGKACCHPPSRR